MTLLKVLLKPVHILVAALNAVINPSAYVLLTTANWVVGAELHSTVGLFNLILLVATVLPNRISPVKLLDTPILILDELTVVPDGPITTFALAPLAKLIVGTQSLAKLTIPVLFCHKKHVSVGSWP